MTCDACEEAAREPSHTFVHGCSGCKARAAARSQHFRRVQKTGMQDRHYREFLRQAEVTHDQVKAAAAGDALGKGAA